MAALKAGQAGGGDKRGMQSAALLVVRKNGGYLGANDRFIDIRVYDAPTRSPSWNGLLALHKLHFFPSEPADLFPITPAIVAQLEPILLAEPVNQPDKWLKRKQGECHPGVSRGAQEFHVLGKLRRAREDGRQDRPGGAGRRFGSEGKAKGDRGSSNCSPFSLLLSPFPLSPRGPEFSWQRSHHHPKP